MSFAKRNIIILVSFTLAIVSLSLSIHAVLESKKTTRKEVVKLPHLNTDNAQFNTLTLEKMTIHLQKVLTQMSDMPDRKNEVQSITLKDQWTPASLHVHLGLDKEDNERLSLDELYTTDHVRGVETTNNAIVIKYPGLYYIYSNIVILRKYCQELETLHHYVHVTNPYLPSNTGVLLRSSISIPTNCTQMEESSFVAGTFTLLEGEQLNVCLSDGAKAELNNKDSFIGIFMLTSRLHNEN